MTRLRLRRICLWVSAVAVVGLAAIIFYDTYGTSALLKNAARVKIGDDQARVRSILGKPRESTSGGGMFFGNTDWWAYGSYAHDFDWQHPFSREFPWIVPLKWHLFSPDTNDVVIYFDGGGKVSRIHIPAK